MCGLAGASTQSPATHRDQPRPRAGRLLFHRGHDLQGPAPVQRRTARHRRLLRLTTTRHDGRPRTEIRCSDRGPPTRGHNPSGCIVALPPRPRAPAALPRHGPGAVHTRGLTHPHSKRAAPIAIRAEPFQADRYDGSPGHPAGATAVALPPGPNSLFKRGVNVDAVAGAPFPCRAVVISGAAPGTTCGNHRANYPRHHRTPSGMVFAVQMHEPVRKAGRNPYLIPPYKRGAGGSNPPAPTKFLQLDGLFETLIGNPVTTAGNHRCMLPDGGRVPKGAWQVDQAADSGTAVTGAFPERLAVPPIGVRCLRCLSAVDAKPDWLSYPVRPRVHRLTDATCAGGAAPGP